MLLTSASLMLLLTRSWIIAVSADTPVTVKPGDNATLHCRADSDGSIDQIAWEKNDLESKKYVFFFRREGSDVNYQLPSFHGRVELLDPQMKDGDASVVLKNATAADSGKYECVVLMREGRRRKRAAPFRHTVHLKVDSGPKAGGSEEGGNKDEGNKDEGNKDEGILHGHSGLIVSIVAVVGICVSVVIGLVAKKRPMKKKSEQPAADEQQHLSSTEPVEV